MLVALVLGGIVALVAACGSTSPSAVGPSGTVVSGSTTTTSTTLPPTFGIPGTSPIGSLSTLGSIQRVVVVPPPVGAVAATPPAPGAPPLPSERIAFRRFGSGPDLLLISGEHSTTSTWDPKFLLDLSAHYRVTIFDFPGVGYSAPPIAPPSVRSYADAAAGLADALGLIRPIVVGWGLGGGVALALAERHPGLLSGVVLINSTVGAPGARITDGAAAILGSSAVTPTVLSQLYFPPADEAARLGWLERTEEISPDTIVATSVAEEALVERRAEGDASLVRDLSSVSLPVLVLAATDDAVSEATMGRVIANEIPHASYVLIPHGGYATFSVDEPGVLDAIASFVTATLAG